MQATFFPWFSLYVSKSTPAAAVGVHFLALRLPVPPPPLPPSHAIVKQLWFWFCCKAALKVLRLLPWPLLLTFVLSLAFLVTRALRYLGLPGSSPAGWCAFAECLKENQRPVPPATPLSSCFSLKAEPSLLLPQGMRGDGWDSAPPWPLRVHLCWASSRPFFAEATNDQRVAPPSAKFQSLRLGGDSVPRVSHHFPTVGLASWSSRKLNSKTCALIVWNLPEGLPPAVVFFLRPPFFPPSLTCLEMNERPWWESELF